MKHFAERMLKMVSYPNYDSKWII